MSCTHTGNLASQSIQIKYNEVQPEGNDKSKRDPGLQLAAEVAAQKEEDALRAEFDKKRMKVSGLDGVALAWTWT